MGTSIDFRIVGFPLYLLPQDKENVYLSFKLGNNEGGKNRWFGRGRSNQELRTATQTDQLAVDIRQALQKSFPEPLFKHPTLSGEWLTLARLPLADLKAEAEPAKRTALKTLILEKLLHAFVIAEKLRDDSLKAAGMQANNTDIEDEFSTLPTMSTPLNQILYGPPGTGKTYHTAVRAIGLLEGWSDDEVIAVYPNRQDLRREYEKYHQAGQIQFVTFHQAFSYEDFVEGIKPVLDKEEADESAAAAALRYTIAAGVFKTLAERSLYLVHWQQQQRVTTISEPQSTPDFDTAFEQFADHLRELLYEATEESPVVFHTKTGVALILQSVNTNGTAYLRYQITDSNNELQVTRNGLRIIDEANPDVMSADINSANFVVNHGRDRTVYRTLFREFWNFRQDLAHTISTPLDASSSVEKALQRVVEDPAIASEVIQRLDLRELSKEDYAASPRFVLIIDEINRGNVANIFGELITLLEDDKRAGRPEALTVKLPYSKEDFTVPENLYLLGTMNTADRSVEALDTALRRRFSFTEMRPEAGVIREQVNQGIIGEGGPEAVDVALLLEVLNSRLEQLLDRDHCLGHALLLHLTTLAGLRAAFQRNIVPLLQEYFFGDWGKIGLVLGVRFVEVVSAASDGQYALAKFPGYEAAGLRDRKLYRLTQPAGWDAAAFRSIYAPTAATATT